MDDWGGGIPDGGDLNGNGEFDPGDIEIWNDIEGSSGGGGSSGGFGSGGSSGGRSGGNGGGCGCGTLLIVILLLFVIVGLSFGELGMVLLLLVFYFIWLVH